MDQARDAEVRHRAVERFEIGDVAAHEMDHFKSFAAKNRLKSVARRVLVENPRPRAALDQVLDDPGSNKALGAGDEIARIVWRVGSRRHSPGLYGLKKQRERGFQVTRPFNWRRGEFSSAGTGVKPPLRRTAQHPPKKGTAFLARSLTCQLGERLEKESKGEFELSLVKPFAGKVDRAGHGHKAAVGRPAWESSREAVAHKVIRHIEVWRIGKVERLHAELQVVPFRQFKPAVNSEVIIGYTWATQNVEPGCAQPRSVYIPKSKRVVERQTRVNRSQLAHTSFHPIPTLIASRRAKAPAARVHRERGTCNKTRQPAQLPAAGNFR